jgi:hypothetical protein
LAKFGQDIVTSSAATWQQLFGQDKHRWAFVVNFIIIYICTAVPGGRFSNPPTSASPVRYASCQTKPYKTLMNE